ncbi:MAG: hypothetical protein HC876_00565 [Chloroflexaceae bacterium]|nr:hypothetical protein [Chloroflexaceae bacterium]
MPNNPSALPPVGHRSGKKSSLAKIISRLQRLPRILSNYAGYAWVNMRYGNVKHFDLHFGGVHVRYSTEDFLSRQWFFPDLAGGKIYEEKVTRLLMTHLVQSRCFADVGTHLGYYSCLAGKLMLQRPVYGFEMSQATSNVARRNIELNQLQNVHLLNAAVSDTVGTASYDAAAATQVQAPGC